MSEDPSSPHIKKLKRHTINGTVPRLSQNISDVKQIRKRVSAREFLIDRVSSMAQDQQSEFQMKCVLPQNIKKFYIHNQLDKYGFQPYSKQNFQSGHVRETSTLTIHDISEKAQSSKQRRIIPLKLPEPTLSGFDLDIQLTNTIRNVLGTKFENFQSDTKNQKCLDSTLVEILEIYPKQFQSEKISNQNQVGSSLLIQNQNIEQNQRSHRLLNLRKILGHQQQKQRDQTEEFYTQRTKNKLSNDLNVQYYRNDSQLNNSNKDSCFIQKSINRNNQQKDSTNLRLQMPTLEQSTFMSIKPSPFKSSLKSISHANLKTQTSSPEKSITCRKSVGKHFLFSLQQPY